jgi:hypothetical protein
MLSQGEAFAAQQIARLRKTQLAMQLAQLSAVHCADLM